MMTMIFLRERSTYAVCSKQELPGSWPRRITVTLIVAGALFGPVSLTTHEHLCLAVIAPALIVGPDEIGLIDPEAPRIGVERRTQGANIRVNTDCGGSAGLM